MRESLEAQLEPEKAFLVAAAVRGSRPLLGLDESLDELSLLAKTAGMQVIGSATQTINQIDPSTFVGSGKLEEIGQSLVGNGAQVVIFDDELSPRHQREIEKRFTEAHGLKDIKVLDRSALILDIFAQHAQTREGSLQVELAQYEYRLPRLTRQWTHLSRQTGGSGPRAGAGLRGPGETQLEVDKREINRKISKLKRDLDGVRQHRSRHREQRSRTGIPVVALVGYTNAGKSTLLNALTNANVYVADQLFATLDPTTRRVNLPSGRAVLFTDTVGFIQKLPTTLIAAFRATLEEIIEADVLLHVVDTAHPHVLQHIEAVEDTLAELDMPPVPRLLVWNKTDLWRHDYLPQSPETEAHLGQVKVSAQTKQGMESLLVAIEEALSESLREATLLLPYQRGELLSYLYAHGTVISQDHTPEGVRVVVQLPNAEISRFKSFQTRKG